jgi:Sec7-like guanine-nucleotide exchange factor
VGAKVLLYSRQIEMDKIAECLGGKDDLSKQVMDQYLEMQDYEACQIEVSLRSFMQTFRMAGIDSQVVFRILE